MIITYQSKQYEVPEWARYVAQDPDGDVYAYSEKPWIGNIGWGKKRGVVSKTLRISTAKKQCEDWENSLFTVKNVHENVQ